MNNPVEIVRVLRIVEYIGPRKDVENAVERSVHGTKRIGASGTLLIRATTLGEYPELMASNPTPDPQLG